LIAILTRLFSIIWKYRDIFLFVKRDVKIKNNMSGHSKWATIKRQKGAADQKRGQLFTKLASAITIAVISGGGIGDPDQNFKLRLAIEKARQANMPKENIERAINTASGKFTSRKFEEATYEGYGPGGVAILVETATDNRMRTYAELKNLFDKNGGSLATPGAVAYLFEQKGLLTVSLTGKSREDVELAAIDAGADDVEEAGNQILVYTDPQELIQVKKRIENVNLSVTDAELTMRSTITVALTNVETAKKVLSLVNNLEENPDVQKVHANFDIPDGLISNSTV
jgi:YebC/PmpR family DNA-binding regulatory protein